MISLESEVSSNKAKIENLSEEVKNLKLLLISQQKETNRLNLILERMNFQIENSSNELKINHAQINLKLEKLENAVSQNTLFSDKMKLVVGGAISALLFFQAEIKSLVNFFFLRK